MSKTRKILILGGANSGKSAYALKLASEIADGGPKTYVATATALDEEMEKKIEKHKAERALDSGWRTVEEPVQLYDDLHQDAGGVVLIDCITLWITNLLGLGRNDETINHDIEKLNDAIVANPSSVIVVSNELGLGIVPEHELSRHFRELSGRANEAIASVVDEAYLVVAGQPLRIK